MRAVFSLKFALGGHVFDLKAFPTVDESAVTIKRTTRLPVKNVSAAPASVESVSVSAADVSVVSEAALTPAAPIKGVETDSGFVEISDAELESCRMSNGEARVLGCVYSPFEVGLLPKSPPYRVFPTKMTPEAVQRFLGLYDEIQASCDDLLIEAASRGVQRLYLLQIGEHRGVIEAVEVAYREEVVETYPQDEALAAFDGEAQKISFDDVPVVEFVPVSEYKRSVAALIEKKMEAL